MCMRHCGIARRSVQFQNEVDSHDTLKEALARLQTSARILPEANIPAVTDWLNLVVSLALTRSVRIACQF